MERIYLDYAATTFIKEEVYHKMQPFLTERFGNPSAVYESARNAKKAMEDSRAKIAALMGARHPKEVYFTSGGTEGNNWVLQSAMRGGGHLITTLAEHHTVLSPCEALQKQGADVTFLPVDQNGMVTAKQVADAMQENTRLVSVMMANNEVGTINPVEEIAQATRQGGALFHTDAVAAAGHMPLCAEKFDFLTISAHKFYGPKGVGAVYIKDGVKLAPLLYGGQQERGMRAGTEHVAGIVGMAAALELAYKQMEREEQRLAELRNVFERELLNAIPVATLNGADGDRLNCYVNVCLPIQASAALVALDMAGIECASGSACMTGGVEPSHVLMAMGVPRERAKCALRFTLGANTTKEHIMYTVRQLAELCARQETKV